MSVTAILTLLAAQVVKIFYEGDCMGELAALKPGVMCNQIVPVQLRASI